MLVAVLSAVYDYETDWYQTNDPHHSLFRKLLDSHVADENVREAAFELFLSDLKGSISRHGLERGNIALRFYHALIGSDWLSAHSDQQIGEYGRHLQMVDDLLDFDADSREGCTNCFLTKEKSSYVRKVQDFMSGAFFSKLASGSLVYAIIKLRCQCMCNLLTDTRPQVRDFVSACRPLAMVYAASTALLGFRFAAFEWLPALITAIAFAGITGSIMVFNDFIDREHDIKKGKLLSSQHTWLVVQFWFLLAGVVLASMLCVAILDVWLAVYICAVWIIGLAYSIRAVRSWYMLQPLIVAGCSAAPALVGCIYHNVFSAPALLTAAAFASIIVMREIVKDIEDHSYDTGYKETISVRFGHIPAVFALLGLCFLPAMLLALHPFWAVRLTGYGLAAVQASNGLLLLNQKRVGLTKASIDGVVASTIVAALLVA